MDVRVTFGWPFFLSDLHARRAWYGQYDELGFGIASCRRAGERTFEEIPALVEHYREDPRQQVIKACERALKRHAKELSERERVNGMYELMHELGGDGVVVGVDEVGRGSVAGPLTVCAVCLPMEPRVWGINDSKKLTPARRELLSVKIAEVATAIGFCHIAPKDIDEMGMARAIRAAVAGAVADTGLEPDCVLMTVTPWAPFPTSATWSRAMPKSPVSPRRPSWLR